MSSLSPPRLPGAFLSFFGGRNRSSGELRRGLLASDNGAAAPELPTVGRAPPTPSMPSDLKPTRPIRRYPSGVNLSKEPLSFLRIEPAVRIRLLKNTLSLSENVKFVGLVSKYVFSNYKFATDFLLLIKYLF